MARRQIRPPRHSPGATTFKRRQQLQEITGCTTTSDSAGCQKNIAAQIVEKDAYYVLAAKRNQPSLDEALQKVFREGIANGFAELKHECLVENSHGRVEQRATHILQLQKDFAPKSEWAGLNTMVVVIRNWKTVGDPDSPEHREQRTFISNHRLQSKHLRRAPRSHRSIENRLHWVLDVQLREDYHQLHDRNGSANLAFLLRLADSPLRQDTQTKSAWESKTKDSEQQSTPTTFSAYSQTPSFSALALPTAHTHTTQRQSPPLCNS